MRYSIDPYQDYSWALTTELVKVPLCDAAEPWEPETPLVQRIRFRPEVEWRTFKVSGRTRMTPTHRSHKPPTRGISATGGKHSGYDTSVENHPSHRGTVSGKMFEDHRPRRWEDFIGPNPSSHLAHWKAIALAIRSAANLVQEIGTVPFSTDNVIPMGNNQVASRKPRPSSEGHGPGSLKFQPLPSSRLVSDLSLIHI